MKNKLISRRSFNKAMITGGVVLSVGLPAAISSSAGQGGQDGLLHINTDGELRIYSGVALLGNHGSEDAISPVCDVLGIKKYRIMSGLSPKHLPAILGQHQTDLCFSTVKTNLKAARLLKSFLKVGVRSGKYIEDGVAHSTHALALSLDPKGMTIAVKA